MHETPRPAVALSDMIAYAKFRREAESQGIATPTGLDWWVRHRRENGLLASGALIEKRTHPGSKRLLLFVNRPRFAAWLAGDDGRVAA